MNAADPISDPYLPVNGHASGRAGADFEIVVREQVRRSRAAQGLAPAVSDPVALAKIAALLASGGAR